MAWLGLPGELLAALVEAAREVPLSVLFLAFISLVFVGLLAIFALLHVVAPKPRAPYSSEKTYLTTDPSGKTVSRQLPCWYDRWLSELRARTTKTHDDAGLDVPDVSVIEPAEVEVTVVIPAYNEALRILPCLEKIVLYCDEHFRRPARSKPDKKKAGRAATQKPTAAAGYEIIVIDDASTDATADVVLSFARAGGLHDVLRVVTLEKNRGKGGGVTHGFRHARGEYVVFADADGASRFSDLGRLIEGCDIMADGSGRGIAIGSRAHLVGSDAVVKVS